jgi:hypothetical protein
MCIRGIDVVLSTVIRLDVILFRQCDIVINTVIVTAGTFES